MKAITVKYLPPTNHKGSRFKASADGWGSITVSYDYGHPMPEMLAAKALIDRVNAENEKEGRQHRVEYPSHWGATQDGTFVFTLPGSEIPWSWDETPEMVA